MSEEPLGWRNSKLLTMLFSVLRKWITLDGLGDTNATFYFWNNAVFFGEAKSLCLQKGAKLFEPRKKNVAKIVIESAKIAGTGDFWLGIHDKNDEGNFVYDSDDTPIVWSNWGPGEPNNHG